MKKIIKKVLPFYSWIYRKISAKILDDGHLFYSQDGEDCVMGYFFQTNKNGFYVDVGAHHPKYLSNTYRAYKIGWSGINIDPMPGFAEKFKKVRPRDICLEMGVSKTQDRLSYYSFETPEMNTFSEEEANESLSEGNKLLAKIDIDTLPLSSILDQSLPEGKNIDFLSVDVEGFDMIVLESNNLDKYLPRTIAIEEMIAERKAIALFVTKISRREGERVRTCIENRRLATKKSEGRIALLGRFGRARHERRTGDHKH